MLKRLELDNFTLFPQARLDFAPGLNVIVGENGTCKSHLLKLKQRLKAIDSHPKVVNQYTLTAEMPWSVAGVTG